MWRGLFRGKKYSVGKSGEKLPQEHEGLPDSTRPHGLCPRCQKQSGFDATAPQPVTFDPEIYSVGGHGPTLRFTSIKCQSCTVATVGGESSSRSSIQPITPGARKPEEGAPSLGEAYTGGPQRTPTCLPTYPQKSLTCSRMPRERCMLKEQTKRECVSMWTDIPLRHFYDPACGGSMVRQSASSQKRRTTWQSQE